MKGTGGICVTLCSRWSVCIVAQALWQQAFIFSLVSAAQQYTHDVFHAPQPRRETPHTLPGPMLPRPRPKICARVFRTDKFALCCETALRYLQTSVTPSIPRSQIDTITRATMVESLPKVQICASCTVLEAKIADENQPTSTFLHNLLLSLNHQHNVPPHHPSPVSHLPPPPPRRNRPPPQPQHHHPPHHPLRSPRRRLQRQPGLGLHVQRPRLDRSSATKAAHPASPSRPSGSTAS